MKRDELLQLIENEFGPGCAAICKERARQKEVKGYDIERDIKIYEHEQLAYAAVTYSLSNTDIVDRDVYWPWDLNYYNPTPDDRPREFEKAGALLAAQLDVEFLKKKS